MTSLYLFSLNLIKLICLDFKYAVRSGPLWEEHNSEGGSHSSGWQVGVEPSQNSASVSMGSANASPDSSKSLVLLAGLGFVDVGNPFTEVVLGTASIINTLKSEDGLVDILLDF